MDISPTRSLSTLSHKEELIEDYNELEEASAKPNDRPFLYKGFCPQYQLTHLSGEQEMTIPTIGQERTEFEKTKGSSLSERTQSYRGYLHNKNITTSLKKAHLSSKLVQYKSLSRLTDFFHGQQQITLDNTNFIKSQVPLIRKVVSYTIGSTVSAVAEAIFHFGALIKNVAVVASNFIAQTAEYLYDFKASAYDGYQQADLSIYSKRVEAGLKGAKNNIYQIVRNVFRAVPVIGHFLGEGLDKATTAAIDVKEQVSEKAHKKFMSYWRPLTPVTYRYECVNGEDADVDGTLQEIQFNGTKAGKIINATGETPQDVEESLPGAREFQVSYESLPLLLAARADQTEEDVKKTSSGDFQEVVSADQHNADNIYFHRALGFFLINQINSEEEVKQTDVAEV